MGVRDAFPLGPCQFPKAGRHAVLDVVSGQQSANGGASSNGREDLRDLGTGGLEIGSQTLLGGIQQVTDALRVGPGRSGVDQLMDEREKTQSDEAGRAGGVAVPSLQCR